MESGLLGGAFHQEKSGAGLVVDAQPLDARVAALLDEVLHQGGQPVGKGIDVRRRAVDPAHRIVAELRVGQPGRVAPHLLEEHVGAVLLVPVEDAVQDPHLRAVEGELAALGLVDPLLDLDAVPVQPEPTGVPVDLLPCPLVLGRRIAAPAAAAVAVAVEDRVLDAVGDRRLDGVPRCPQAAAHGVDRLAAIDVDRHRARGAGAGAIGEPVGRRARSRHESSETRNEQDSQPKLCGERLRECRSRSPRWAERSKMKVSYGVAFFSAVAGLAASCFGFQYSGSALIQSSVT